MKIKDVKCEVYLWEQAQLPPRRGGLRDFPRPAGKIPFPIFRIKTDEGIEGHTFYGSAMPFRPRTISESDVNIVRQEIVGKDPFDREWIWQRLWLLLARTYFGTAETISAVDTALWDIAGKVLGLPVYKLMGGYRDKIKVYASSSPLPTVEECIEDALLAKEQGITAYKIHPHWGKVKEDVELCRAVRKAAGDDMILMHDPWGRYTREEALRVGRELEKLNFYWFEEPIRDHDIEGLIMLREKLTIPICATEEAQRNLYSLPEYLVRRAVDIVRCDTLISGGITPCKKIADMCDAFGMQCEIHTGAGPTANIANLHVECAIKNCEFYEMFPWPDETRFGLTEYPVLDNEGYIHIPQKPGLGFEFDREALGKPVASY